MDEKLILAALKGDSVAFEELYKNTFPRAHAIALGIVKDDFEAFDIVQESYVTLLQKGNTLKDPKKLESWFAQIVRNTAIDFVRKNRPTVFSDIESPEEDGTPLENTILSQYDSFDPEKTVDYAETKRLIRELIDALPEKQRLCVILRWQEDKKIGEIAQITGLSEATVKSCLRYGHDKLAKGVQELEKKGTKLYGVSPLLLIPFLRWMLGGKAPAQAAAAVSGTAATAAGTAAAAGTSFVTKVVAGVLTAVLTVGGAVGIVQLAKPAPTPQTTLSAEDTRPPVYTTTFGDTIVITPEPITEYEGQPADAPSRVLEVWDEVVDHDEDQTPVYAPGKPQHYMGAVPVTRVVIPEYLPNAAPNGWFYGLKDVISIQGLENIDTSNAHSLEHMFHGCESLERVTGIANWDVGKVYSFQYMFAGCHRLAQLDDLSAWRPREVLLLNSMFEECAQLTHIYGLAGWDYSWVNRMDNMFRGCVSLVGVDGLEALGAAVRATRICMLERTAISPLPLWYIEYELCGVDRPAEEYRDIGCFTEESLRIFYQAYPDYPPIEGYPIPEAQPTEPENIGATDTPTGADPEAVTEPDGWEPTEPTTEPTEFVGMYKPDEEQPPEDFFIGMADPDEE